MISNGMTFVERSIDQAQKNTICVTAAYVMRYWETEAWIMAGSMKIWSASN